MQASAARDCAPCAPASTKGERRTGKLAARSTLRDSRIGCAQSATSHRGLRSLDSSAIQTYASPHASSAARISDECQECQGATATGSALAHEATIRPRPLHALGTFAHNWARVKSQVAIDQLNDGVRAIDLRTIRTSPADQLSSAAHDLQANHRVHSKETALSRLGRIGDWMGAHPSETQWLHGPLLPFPRLPMGTTSGFSTARSSRPARLRRRRRTARMRDRCASA